MCIYSYEWSGKLLSIKRNLPQFGEDLRRDNRARIGQRRCITRSWRYSNAEILRKRKVIVRKEHISLNQRVSQKANLNDPTAQVDFCPIPKQKFTLYDFHHVGGTDCRDEDCYK